MRPIKFRAWDKVEGKMLNVHNILFGDIFEPKFLQCLHGKGGTNGPEEDYELMQFTGLRDKNGKEIYEGDIVDLGTTTGNSIVKMDNFWLMYILEKTTGIEVIGNIYEHSNLLK